MLYSTIMLKGCHLHIQGTFCVHLFLNTKDIYETWMSVRIVNKILERHQSFTSMLD